LQVGGLQSHLTEQHIRNRRIRSVCQRFKIQIICEGDRKGRPYIKKSKKMLSISTIIDINGNKTNTVIVDNGTRKTIQASTFLAWVDNGLLTLSNKNTDNSTYAFTLATLPTLTVNDVVFSTLQDAAVAINELADFSFAETTAITNLQTALGLLALQNAPNTWVVGTEYDFGNGLFGQVFTGSVAVAAGAPSLVTIPLPGPITLVQEGGSWTINGVSNFPANTIFYGNGDISNYASDISVNYQGTSPSLLFQFISMSTSFTANYNFWILYTKTTIV
jgi:hypothetical protein